MIMHVGPRATFSIWKFWCRYQGPGPSGRGPPLHYEETQTMSITELEPQVRPEDKAAFGIWAPAVTPLDADLAPDAGRFAAPRRRVPPPRVTHVPGIEGESLFWYWRRPPFTEREAPNIPNPSARTPALLSRTRRFDDDTPIRKCNKPQKMRGFMALH